MSSQRIQSIIINQNRRTTVDNESQLNEKQLVTFRKSKKSYKVTAVCIYMRACLPAALLSGLTGLAEAGDALLQKLQCQMGLISSQSLADGDYEEGVVCWDAEARCLQQLALYL